MKRLAIIGVIASFVLTGCSADILPKTVRKDPNNKQMEAKGRALIEQAWKKQGYENFYKHTSFTFTAEDHWKGMMGKMGKLWPEARQSFTMSGTARDFDTKVTFDGGKKDGLTAGLDNDVYYEIPKGGKLEKVKTNNRHKFGMEAYHFFIEMMEHARHATVVQYVDQRTFNGREFDVVFMSWGTHKKQKDVDQYLFYFQKGTGMLEYAVYTVREVPLKVPGSKMFYGSMRFKDYKNVDGFMVPMTQTVFLNNIKKKDKKFLHQLKMKSFEFDKTTVADINPL